MSLSKRWESSSISGSSTLSTKVAAPTELARMLPGSSCHQATVGPAVSKESTIGILPCTVARNDFLQQDFFRLDLQRGLP